MKKPFSNKEYKPQIVKNEIAKLKGKVKKDLRHHKGIVAELSPFKVRLLIEKFDLHVELDHVYQASSRARGGCSQDPIPDEPLPPQPDQSTPWGIDSIMATQAWHLSKGLDSVVCVVDTGIDYNHPDLKENILGGDSFVSGVDYYDDNGHGSHVAGTIAALDNGIGVVGVAPLAKIFAVKVLDKSGSGYSSDVADGIRSCIKNGADIINLSLGSNTPASIIENAVKDALSSGLIVIAAAGNNGAAVGFPAAYRGVVAVSAIDQQMNLAYFSSRGPEIDFAAPGVDVLSTVPNGDYDSYDGTSMASPHVAGVAALMLSAKRAVLKADNIGLPSNHQGQGLINALKSVQ